MVINNWALRRKALNCNKYLHTADNCFCPIVIKNCSLYDHRFGGIKDENLCSEFLFLLRRPLTPKAADESRRAGFDERLCYGDVVLGFRYFPTGLPTDVENRPKYILVDFDSEQEDIFILVEGILELVY